LLWTLASSSGDDEYTADAIISNLKNREKEFLNRYQSVFPDSGRVLSKRLNRLLEDIEKTKTKPGNKKDYPKGAAIYQTVCQPCHGPLGNGVRALAPPLNNSEWVTGSKERLAAVVL